VLLNKLPPTKVSDFDSFPLSSKLGFIHFLPEADFDIATATITDVGFTGMFPKPILQELKRQSRELKELNQDYETFDTLIDKLVTAFIYRPITIQKVINILLAKFKASLLACEKAHNATAPTVTTILTTDNELSAPTPPQALRRCYATNCRVLQATGIIRSTMICAMNRSMCSGCTNEQQKHSKVARIETELLTTYPTNHLLAPLLVYRTQPVSIKTFRKLLQHLPSFATKR